MTGGRVVAGVLGLGLVLAVLARLVAERRQMRRARAAGRGAIVHATAASTPRRRQGPVAESVAAWQPARPSSSVGRALALAWAAPVTLPALALGRAGGGSVARDHEHGVWLVTGVDGRVGAFLRAGGAAAVTGGQAVLTKRDRPSAALVAHEAAHARQYERLGPLFLVVYGWFWLRYGYADNPFERGARTAARRHASAVGPVVELA